MFAVEGWNLGKIVAQTQPKKKLKRKRGEKEKTVSEGDRTPVKGSRKNPFSIKDQHTSNRRKMDADPNSVTTSSLELAKIGQINTETSESLKIRAQKKAAKKAEKRLR